LTLTYKIRENELKWGKVDKYGDKYLKWGITQDGPISFLVRRCSAE